MFGKITVIAAASVFVLFPAHAGAGTKKGKSEFAAHSSCASASCIRAKADIASRRSKKRAQTHLKQRNQEAIAVGRSVVTGHLTAYSPQKNGCKMEGGYASSRPGPDRKAVVRTLADVASGRSEYITIAGSPKFYGHHYRIPAIDFVDAQGRLHALKNVRAVVHDTGGAFRHAPEGRYDIPVERDISNKLMVRNASLWKRAGVGLVFEGVRWPARVGKGEMQRPLAQNSTKVDNSEL